MRYRGPILNITAMDITKKKLHFSTMETNIYELIRCKKEVTWEKILFPFLIDQPMSIGSSPFPGRLLKCLSLLSEMIFSAKHIAGQTSRWGCEWFNSVLPEEESPGSAKPLPETKAGPILSKFFQATASRHKVPELPCHKTRSFICLLTATPQLPWAHYRSINVGYNVILTQIWKRTGFYRKQNIQHALFRKKNAPKHAEAVASVQVEIAVVTMTTSNKLQ